MRKGRTCSSISSVLSIMTLAWPVPSKQQYHLKRIRAICPLELGKDGTPSEPGQRSDLFLLSHNELVPNVGSVFISLNGVLALPPSPFPFSRPASRWLNGSPCGLQGVSVSQRPTTNRWSNVPSKSSLRSVRRCVRHRGRPRNDAKNIQ